MGKKHLKQYGICTGHIGQESAIFLQADPERHGELEKIYFFISKGGLPGTRFRVHVYDIDTGYMPGNDLLDSNMILHANSGDEWVEADVSNMHILLSRSVFVSMEWISGYENNTDLVSYDKYSEQGTFNGQILAFTQGYCKKGSLFYSRKNANTKWTYFTLQGSSWRNTLNPMIYTTYTYYEK